MKQFNILIATPCATNTVNVQYTQTILKIFNLSKRYKSNFSVDYKVVIAAEISKARNALVAHFMNDSSYTHILFVDNDMKFDAQLVQRLLDFDKPVVAALCPYRSINKDGSISIVCADFVDKQTLTDGFVKTSTIGAAIMLIRREVFEKITIAYPNLISKNGTFYKTVTDKPVLQCFSPLQNDSGDFLSEDLSFCKRWTSLNGEIWACADQDVTHIGYHEFTNSYIKSI